MRPSLQDAAREYRQAKDRNHREAVKLAWRETFEGYIWHLFVTLTFTRPCLHEGAQRRFNGWLREWQGRRAEELGLAKWDGRRRHWVGQWGRQARRGRHLAVYVLGLEKFRRASGVHLHAMIKWPSELGTVHLKDDLDVRKLGTRLWQCWRFGGIGKDWGGSCRIEVPRNADKAADYVAKEVCKGGEITISQNFRAVGVGGLL